MLLFIILLFFSVSEVVNAHCVVFSCDGSISYAIQRYANKTVLRLSNFNKTIATSTNLEKTLHKVEDEKLLELKKYRERLKIEWKLSIQEANIHIPKD